MPYGEDRGMGRGGRGPMGGPGPVGGGRGPMGGRDGGRGMGGPPMGRGPGGVSGPPMPGRGPAARPPPAPAPAIPDEDYNFEEVRGRLGMAGGAVLMSRCKGKQGSGRCCEVGIG